MQPQKKQIYSLSRLAHKLKLKGFLDPHEVIRVGGRVHQAGEKTQLSGSGYTLEFPALQSITEQALVSVEFAIGDLKKEGNVFHAEKVRETQVIHSPTVGKNRVDLSARGQSGVFSATVAYDWAQFLLSVREYFTGLGLLEVTTPTLVRNPGMEPELEPFATELKMGSKRQQLFLATSPELHLKQLMVQGLTDIFEIKTVFRNEENTEIHEPEFQMIEWYRGFADLDMIISDLKGLIEFLKRSSHVLKNNFQFQEIRMPQLFQEILQFSLTPQTSREELIQLLVRIGEKPDVNATWNDLFHHVWVAKIEPRFPSGMVILRDFPASQAALAKINERGFADRMELFWDGVEIANAFHELTDPVEQRKRFERDQKLRIQYGRTPLSIDENFMSALEMGLPPSAGIALGLDRLFMKCAGIGSIQEARAFGVRHQLSN